MKGDKGVEGVDYGIDAAQEGSEHRIIVRMWWGWRTKISKFCIRGATQVSKKAGGRECTVFLLKRCCNVY